MRGDIMVKALEALAETASDSFTFAETILTSGYGASSGKLLRTFSKIKNRKEREKRKLKHYYDLLYRLKRDGLVEEKELREGKLFFITKKGKEKLRLLKAKRLLQPRKYLQKAVSHPTIVAFDIPENERKKRRWLRETLRENEFTLIQQSVWIGKAKLPKEFIDDLRQLRLLDYVHIFEITKSGTL